MQVHSGCRLVSSDQDSTTSESQTRCRELAGTDSTNRGRGAALRYCVVFVCCGARSLLRTVAVVVCCCRKLANKPKFAETRWQRRNDGFVFVFRWLARTVLCLWRQDADWWMYHRQLQGQERRRKVNPRRTLSLRPWWLVNGSSTSQLIIVRFLIFGLEEVHL